MNYDQLIKFFGTQQKVAAAIGLNQPAVSAYANGRAIPINVQIAAEVATKGKLRADLPAIVRKQAA